MPEVWKPGSFTKNFSWGPPENGLLQLYECIRAGFAGEMVDVERAVFRQRVADSGRSDYIPINFFLFNQTRDGTDFLIADELVFQALMAPHSANFDRLALFALNFSYAGRWTGAESTQRRPALWAYHYVADRVATELKWDAARITASDIQKFIEGDARYKAKSARKVSTNLKYLYQIGRLDAFSDPRVQRWWVDALFLALDRLIEDKALDGVQVPEDRHGALLAASGFAALSGKGSLEKRLATPHLVALFSACGGRARFSEAHVRERTELRIPQVEWFAANDNRPEGAVHPSNPRILKSIPRACAMLARYAGFDIIDADELQRFNIEEFIRTHARSALDRLREQGIVPSMSVEDLMRLTRDK